MITKITILRWIVKFKNQRMVLYFTQRFQLFFEKLNQTNSKLREQLFQSIPFWFASALSGLLAYLYYLIFRLTEDVFLDIYQYKKWSVFILTPIAFLLSWWLVKRYAIYSRGSGIPQVMAAIETSNAPHKYFARKLLGIRIIIVKILSSSLKVLGGGVVGREGPTIQISSSVFHVVYRYLPKWWKPISQKNILIAGAASGLAAAFNTPLGGIVFAIEELSKFHIKTYRSSLFVAVVIAGLVAQTLAGPYLYLGYPKLVTSGWMVNVGVVIVAMTTGFLGAKVGDYLMVSVQFLRKHNKNYQQILIILIVALFIALSIYFLGTDSVGSGKELMERTLFTSNKKVEWYNPIVRILGLIGTFGFGGAGGIFAPSLSIGASVGALVAGWMELSANNTNLLIVIGMTAFLTGITRSPFTSAIIVIEMTDRHSAIFYLMLATVIASAMAYLVSKHSFYDRMKDVFIEDVKEDLHKKEARQKELLNQKGL